MSRKSGLAIETATIKTIRPTSDLFSDRKRGIGFIVRNPLSDGPLHDCVLGRLASTEGPGHTASREDEDAVGNAE